MGSEDKSQKWLLESPLAMHRVKMDTMISLGTLSHTSPRVGCIISLVHAKVELVREGEAAPGPVGESNLAYD